MPFYIDIYEEPPRAEDEREQPEPYRVAADEDEDADESIRSIENA